MAAHGWIGKVACGVQASTVVLLVALPGIAGPTTTGQPASGVADRMCSEAMRGDARLADVSFVDPECGWAVGDRGTIWHTEDGGRQWHLQNSGVSCRLESVQFLDRRTGWAAGGFTKPYTHTGKGVLLATRDGGRTWNQVPGLVLPALKRVRFFDRQHGWAIGNASAMFPSGAFLTDDGGRSWNPLSGERITAWQGGDFLDRNTGALAGYDGTAAAVRRGGVAPAQTPRFGLRRVSDLELVPEIKPGVYGWLVGQGGLVMLTSDVGKTWHTPPGNLPPGIAGEFDFATIEVRGANAWIAGSPGTRILYTPDAGRSWFAAPTGQSVPIEALAFADDRHGWAVGQLGTILATSDGGRTWTRQRAGGSRAALLALFNEAEDVPLELLAQLSGDEGYLAAVELTGRRDVETPSRSDVPLEDRVREAVVGVGACAAGTTWQFPLRQPGLQLPPDAIIEGWNRANDGRAIEKLDAYLVGQIRLWRPEVVLTHAAVLADNEQAAGLVHKAVLKAVEHAADPTWYSQQITEAGLEPWKVKRVYGFLGPDSRGSNALATTQLSARLGNTLADVASRPRGLIAERYEPSPQSLGFQLIEDATGRSPERGSFFAGIALMPGGDARRMLADPAADTVDMIRRMAQKRRNTEAILDHSDRDPQKGLGLLAQVGELTSGLDPAGAGEVLYQLGQRYYQAGDWPLAAKTFSRLAEDYPDHPLADAALVWLVQYYGSAEASWRVRGGDRVTIRQVSAPAIDSRQDEDRAEQAATLAKMIETTRPGLYARPEIRFPVAMVARQRGFAGDAERYYLARRLSANHDAWWACAQGEQWLAQPEGVAPKPILRCAVAPEKPQLDGKLDDPVWQRAKPAKLKSPLGDDNDWPGSVMLAYDTEFLYIAVRCRKGPADAAHQQAGQLHPAGSSPDGPADDAKAPPRPRDGDLSTHDRVDVLLDIDRDFATYYRLTVDDRGWPRDACWGDPTWNPTWFVAPGEENGQWTAEAAVPLDQLTGHYPKGGTIWAIGIQRTNPGRGFQSWNTPAETRITPQGFGYLIFD